MLAVLAALLSGALFLPVHVRPAHATIEEQRARLPPPADCTDAVEGVWLAIRYTERHAEWYEYTLNIRRVDAGSDDLTGEMASHFWAGGPEDSHPPSCGPHGLEVLVRMPRATGKAAKDGTIVFGALKYDVDRVLCGSWAGRYYNPDHFTGRIDPARQEFQSVNNDGGKAVNEPAVFRRIRCFDPPRKTPQHDASPPAFAPAKRGVSCGR